MRTNIIIRVLLLATLFILVSTLGAQSPASWVPDGSTFLMLPETLPVPSVRVAQPAMQKSVGTAMTISLVSTYVPLGIALASGNSGAAFVSSIGVLIGPSTGYWYAGSGGWKHGMYFRLAMEGVALGGALLASQCGLTEANTGCTAGEILILGAATGILVDGIVDIAKLPKAVRSENAARLSVSPTVAMNGKTVGVNMSVKF